MGLWKLHCVCNQHLNSCTFLPFAEASAQMQCNDTCTALDTLITRQDTSRVSSVNFGVSLLPKLNFVMMIALKCGKYTLLLLVAVIPKEKKNIIHKTAGSFFYVCVW